MLLPTEFNSLDSVTWISSGYILAQAATLPTFGQVRLQESYLHCLDVAEAFHRYAHSTPQNTCILARSSSSKLAPLLPALRQMSTL